SAGNLTFTWNDPTATGVTLDDGTVLVELCFTVIGDQTTTITFSGMPTAIEVTDANEESVAFNGVDATVTIGSSGPNPLLVNIADASAVLGTAVCLPINVTNFTDLTDVQFSINYDATRLEFVNAQNFNPNVPGLGSMSVTNPSAGSLVLSWSNTTGVTLPNGARLLELCFNTLNTGTATLIVSGTPSPIVVTNASDEAVSVTPNNGMVTITPPIGDDEFLLVLADANVAEGDTVCLPLSVRNFTDIVGMQFSLNYDQTKLTFIGTRNELLMTPLPTPSVLQIANPNAGDITATWNDPTTAGVTLDDGTVLVELCFRVEGCMATEIVFSSNPTVIEITDVNEQEVAFNGDNANLTCNLAPPGEFAASMSPAEACDGETFCSSVVASSFSDIQGMEYSINYDASALTTTTFTDFNTGLNGFGAEDLTTSAGNIVVDWSNTSSAGVTLPANSVLFTVCFTKTGDNPTDLTISGTPTAINIVDGNGNNVAYAGATTTIGCTPVPDLEITGVEVVNLNCADECIGSVTITSLNGSGNYTYNWSFAGAGTGPSVTNLCARTVSVTVTDTNTQQTATGTYTITAPPALRINVTNITNILCAGDNTGSITVNASGGVPLPGGTYNFNWGGSLQDNVLTQNNLSAGAYSLTVTDGNGCTTAMNNIQVNELHDPLVSTGVVTNIGGPGEPGSIDLTVTGGNDENGYTYSWTGPGNYSSSSEDPNDITVAGTYSVTVTDQFNCSTTNSFVVPETLRISFFNISVACAGQSNGAIDVTVVGGPLPIDQTTYIWRRNGSPVGTTQDLSGLAPGIYELTAMNGDQSVTGTFEVASNPEIVLSASTTISDLGNNGAIDLSATGGSGTFSYNWSNGATTEDLSGLAPATYCVTVTDENACTAERCFTVPGEPLRVVGVGSEVSCPDATDGCLTLTITGGVGPYDIEITPGNIRSQLTTGTFEICDLAPGNYSYQVTDAQAARVSDSVMVSTPDPIIVTDTIIVNDIVDPVGAGSITLVVTGGTGNLSYTWTSPGTGPAIFGLQGNTYNVTIEDENGCRVTESYVVGTLRDTITITNASCTDDQDGQIVVQVGGGDQPITFRWFDENGQIMGANSSVLANRPPGSYTVEITDGSGAIIQRNGLEIGTESDFTIASAVIEELDCHDSMNGVLRGSVVENNGMTGGFNYEWLDENNQLIGTEATLSGLGPGRYTLTVVDSLNCEQTTVDSLVAPSAVGAVLVELRDLGCEAKDDGAIEVIGAGGRSENYTYAWSNGAQGRRIANLPAGEYSVTVTNSLGCTGEATYSVTATTPLMLTVETEPDTEDCNGTVRAVVIGGTPPYSYSWTNVPANPTDAVVTGLCFGEYFVEVTDARGCTSGTVMGEVANGRFACFEERVVITPDGNGSNDEFILFCADTEFNNNHLEIYNRFGQLVFEVDNYDNTWEGTAQNGEDLPEGPYYWVLDYVEPNGQERQLRGSLTIIRE
ncbi:MAG: hypothetical protein D6772_17555, partial [Bacteroidetes bacterium]